MNRDPYDEFGVHVDAQIRVRYAETDQMGNAYYANYLVWFEVARTNFCRVRGFSYAQLERETETFLPVVEARCRYRRPLSYDDEILVRTWVKEFRKRTLSFLYRVIGIDGHTLYADGETKHVFTDSRGKAKTLPEEYRRFLQG